MKKIMAVLVSAAMLLTVVSCTKSSKDSSSGGSTVQAEPMSLKSADIEMSQDFTFITAIDRSSSSGNILIFGVLKNGDWGGYVTDESFVEHTEFRIEPEEEESILDAAMLTHGKKAVLSWQDGTTRITVFGRTNQQESVIECEDIIADPMSYTRIFSDGDDGFIIWAEDCLSAISADGKYRGDISTGGLSVYSAAETESGMTCMLWDKNDMYLGEVSPGELSIVNKRSCENINSMVIAMSEGMGGYELVAVSSDGLYGLMDGSWIRLCDFMDNTFTAYDILDIIMTKENEFAAVISKGGESRVSLLTERDISEIKAKKVIKIAANKYWVEDMVKYYNSLNEDSEYRIEIIDYFTPAPDSLTVDDLKRDMISGNAPDILVFTSELPIDTFGAKETMFVDLYTLLDKDPDLSREDFLPNILEGLERGGKLLQLGQIFAFGTITARPGYEGIKENWSINDMITAYENLPEGTYMFPDTDKYYMFNFYSDIVNEEFFVDYEKAECNFDSPEYISLLSFFRDNKIGGTMKELGESGNSRPARTDQEGIDVIDMFSNVSTFAHLHSTVKGKYKDDVVFVGYPFDGKRSGSYTGVPYRFGIMANSENIDEAWDFIKVFFSDYYYDNIVYFSLPTRIDKFNERCDEHTRDWTYISYETGEEVTQKWEYQPNNNTSGYRIEIDNFTPEECEYYKNVILSAPLLEGDSTLSRICDEETRKFFEGEYTAEECAKMIQNRASLYLSEHYQ